MTNPVPLTLDKPFAFEQPLDFDEARGALKAAANARRQAREWYQRATLDAAEKERTYRKARARAWPETTGTAEERKDHVNAKTVDLRYARDVSLGVVKAALERLEEVDAERASLHKLVEWSMKVAPLGSAPEPEYHEPIGGRR